MATIFSNQRTRRVLQAGAIVTAIGAGYAIRDLGVIAQSPTGSTVPPVQTAPVVDTAAVRNAEVVQGAFADVAAAVQPAVVTIRTPGARIQNAATPEGGAPGTRPRVRPFGPNDNIPQDFQEFFRQFQRDWGFEEQSFDPDSWHGQVMLDQARARFQEIQSRRGGGVGSGMIYRSDGLIITNAHVVRDANTVSVTLSDGRVINNAKVLGRDDRTDIAVVKIEGSNYPTVKLGSTDAVRVGDWAIAMGNPFGLDQTLTVGVVSAKARQLPLAVGSDTRTDYLQTDASINPGNSGGPLLDITGRVIGVNNAIFSESGGNQGIGFAIPVDTARFVADRIVQDGRVRRAYLGVNIGNIEREGAALGLAADTRGVLISGISDPNAPGARAGLRPGDVVVTFNGQRVQRSGELQQLVGNSPVGSTVTLGVLRGNNTVTLRATLDELPDAPDRTTPEASRRNAARAEATGGAATAIPGLRARGLDANLNRSFGLGNARGVVVTGVEAGSPADEAGITRGDVIEQVGQVPVASLSELEAELRRILSGQTGERMVAFYIERDGKREFRFVRLP